MCSSERGARAFSVVCGTIENMKPTYFDLRRIAGVASLRIPAMVLLLAAAVLLPSSPSFAKGAPLVKTTLITGTAAECGVGLRNGWITRPLVIKLRERPGGRVVAIYTVEPAAQVGTFAFSATPGTYFLTTSESTSMPPRGNIVIRGNSKAVIKVNIATTCQ